MTDAPGRTRNALAAWRGLAARLRQRAGFGSSPTVSPAEISAPPTSTVDGNGRVVIPPGFKGLPDWKAILDTNRPLWERARREAAQGPGVLLATGVGGSAAVSTVESMLAVALTLRGARVHYFLCDKALAACLRCEPQDVPDPGTIERYELPKTLCNGCFFRGEYAFTPLELRHHYLQELLTPDERKEARRIAAAVPSDEIRGYRFEDQAVGEHAYAGALRYFASGNLDDEPKGEVVVRRYFEGALQTAYAMRRLLDQERFSAACFSHGIYAPHGIINEACHANDVRVINWVVAYRKRCFIFSHGDTYHHTLMGEPTAAWEDMAWDEAMERDILEYLQSRWRGSRDWIYYHEKPDEDFAHYARETGLDLDKPTVGLLTNVMWDAQLHYPANAFPDMLDWVLQTIDYFGRRPDLQLLIRIHPAEIRGTVPSRQPILAEIRKRIPKLPPNVFVIPPESPVSTYAAVGVCDAVTIYGTKTGVELTSAGIPTIVAGEAWIRNKGLTLDATSPAEYFRILDRLPLRERMPAEQVTRARKYAYHFFFRRMVPVRFMEPGVGAAPFSVAVSRLDDLLPGADPGLDVLCDGILNGSPFIYPSETLGVDEA